MKEDLSHFILNTNKDVRTIFIKYFKRDIIIIFYNILDLYVQLLLLNKGFYSYRLKNEVSSINEKKTVGCIEATL